MATNLTENYFEYGVHKYFRGNAHLVELGTYGEKKDPIGAKAYIDPQNYVLPAHLVGRVCALLTTPRRFQGPYVDIVDAVENAGPGEGLAGHQRLGYTRARDGCRV